MQFIGRTTLGNLFVATDEEVAAVKDVAGKSIDLSALIALAEQMRASGLADIIAAHRQHLEEQMTRLEQLRIEP